MDLKTKLFLHVEGIRFCNVPVHFKQPPIAGWGTKAPSTAEGRCGSEDAVWPPAPATAPWDSRSFWQLHGPSLCSSQVTSSPRLCCSQE